MVYTSVPERVAAVVCYILAHFSVAGPALTYAQIWERCQFMENMRKAQ